MWWLTSWCYVPEQLVFTTLFLQRSVLIWIKLKITYVIKCEELRIVAANLARYRPNWIFDVFISMKSVKLLLFSFIEWISNLLFFLCDIIMCDIKMPKSHFTNFTKVAKTCVCVCGGGSSTSSSLPCHENFLAWSSETRTSTGKKKLYINIAYMLWTTWIWCVILARVTLNFSTEEPSISCKSNFTEYPPF